jgi:hypothetical protein
MDHGADVDARDSVSLSPITQGEKAQCAWQLGPGDARGFVCLQKLLACQKKGKRKKCRSTLRRQLGLGFSV